MPTDLSYITGLLYRIVRGETLSEGEQATLNQWAAESGYAQEVYDRLRDEKSFDTGLQQRLAENYGGDWERLRARIGEWGDNAVETIPADVEPVPVVRPMHRIHFLKTAWFRYAAAILILFGIGTYLYLTNQKEKSSVTITTNPVPVQNDVLPGGNKAILTLADGSRISLDSMVNGVIAKEGETQIEKKEGQVIYRYPPSEGAPRSGGGGPVTFNTMTTPRGGQYQLRLPDGSQVWLNAESSITYPTVFRGDERRVSITGEVYFEVVKNTSKPFRVTVSPAGGGVREANGGGLEIEVLGTHFNVNTYDGEPTNNITLLEGSVRIKTVLTSLTLKPGQQGQFDPRINQLSLAVNPDLEQVMAWRRGLFNFDNVRFKDAMQQLERWYDVEVEYTNGIPDIMFGGKMQRDLNLSQTLRLLNAMGVTFRIEGKKLIVSQ